MKITSLLLISIYLGCTYAFTGISYPTKSFHQPIRHSRVSNGSSLSRSGQKPTKNGLMKTNSIANTALNMGMFDQDDSELNGTDRLFACLPYIVPLLDGDQFGRFIYMRIPPLKMFEQIFLGPFIRLDDTIPFFGFGLFLGLVFLSRNTGISRGVRFNMQQAILIDIALIFPELIGSAMSKNTPMFLIEPATNFVYYAYVASIGYSIFSNLSGKTPRGIPFISEAADRAIGPF